MTTMTDEQLMHLKLTKEALHDAIEIMRQLSLENIPYTTGTVAGLMRIALKHMDEVLKK